MRRAQRDTSKTAQQWSRAIYRHPQKVDGIVYMSRHVNDAKAVVLFDRAAPKVRATRYRPLPDAPGVARALTALHIRFSYA